MTQLFISHSSKNNAEALALSQCLTQEGWDDQFLDLDPQRGITAGERWEKALHQAAGRCDAVLFLISPDWLASEWCRREFTIAQQLGKRLFVLLIGAARADIPAHIKQSWQVVDLAGGDDHGAKREVTLPGEAQPRFVYFSKSGLARLREGLKKAGLDPESFPWPPADQPNRPPYCGLRPLEAEDAGIFFGREAPIIEMLAQLRGLRDTAPPRFLAILGASGAGKSSFLRAGILPRLARDDRYYLTLPVIRPERAVLSGNSSLLASLWTIRQTRGLSWSRKQLEQAIELGASALAPLLAELVRTGSLPDVEGREAQAPTLVLAIDQAEELFQSEGGAEAARFLALLAELLQTDSPQILVLCTIRSDSYEHLQSAPALLAVSQKTFSLPPLPKGAYRQVIEAPVAILKHSTRPLKIEAKLTDALLTDIEQGGAKDALPLLAFTLERLYLDYSADGLLSLKDYQDLGRIAGAIEKAVAAALDQAQRDPRLPNDRDHCLKLLRRGLIPWMAGIDRLGNQPFRKVALLNQIPEESQPIIEHFVEHRLLTKDKNQQSGITVEPAHEALLRQWTKLRDWLGEDAVALATLESVKAASRDWDASDRSPEWLNHSAGRLEDAEALHQRPDLAAILNDIDRTYLAECQKREGERRDKELLQARELAAAQQQRSEQQQRVVRRTRVGLAVASVLAVVAAMAGLSAWQAQVRAERETERSQAGLKQAAERALGRAREQFVRGQRENYVAYVAESIGFEYTVAADDAALVLQQSASPRLKAVLKHTGPITVAAFSADGTRVVTSCDQTARIWDTQSGAAIGAPLEHTGVHSAAFSPDGRRVVTASAGSAYIWDALSGKWIGTLSPQQIVDVAFSPDGTQVVTASMDHTAQIWDARTHEPIGAPLKHDERVNSVAFSSDGTRVVTASFDKTSRIWDAQSGEAIGNPLKHERLVVSAAFSRDGTRVVTTSDDNSARIWDAQSGEAIGASLMHKKRITSAEFSRDGTRLVTASLDKTAQIWDAQTGVAIGSLLTHTDEVLSATFSPDSRRVVTACKDLTARLWDAQSGQDIGAPLELRGAVTVALFSPDGTRLLTASEDNTARIWVAQSGSMANVQFRHELGVASAGFSADGARLLTKSRDGVTRIWDLQLGSVAEVSLRQGKSIKFAALSSDGKRVLTAGWDHTVRVWDEQSGEAIGSPIKHETGVFAVTFSPDGTRVLTLSGLTARIWDAQSMKIIRSLQYDGGYHSAAFSPDGARVVTANMNDTASIWKTQSGEAAVEPLKHDGFVEFAAFSPDGTRVLTASSVTARIWDAQSGALGTLLTHENSVKSAAFSPDGTRVVTVSADNTVRIWAARGGNAIGAPLKQEDHEEVPADFSWLPRGAAKVSPATFSPEGKRVVTAGWDNTARIWDADSGVTIGTPLKHQKEVVSAAFSPDGRRVVTASEDGTARIWDAQNDEMLGTPVTPDDLIALSGRRVADNGQLEWLTGPEWMALINKVKAQAEQGTTKKDQVMRWHFADPSSRTISPFSQITVRQHIEREIAWVLEHPQTESPNGLNYSPKILDDAYNLDPGHPLILLALSVFEEREEPKKLWIRLSFPRFQKDARLAARAAEILLVAKDPENARQAAEIALALPNVTDADKAKAQAVLNQIAAIQKEDP